MSIEEQHPELTAAGRLATEPVYETFQTITGSAGFECGACGALVGDTAQHSSFHQLLRGILIGLGE